MLNKELREFLSRFPDDMRVVVDGYEDGVDDVVEENTYIVPLKLNDNKGKLEMYGQHIVVQDDAPKDCDAIKLSRANYQHDYHP